MRVQRLTLEHYTQMTIMRLETGIVPNGSVRQLLHKLQQTEAGLAAKHMQFPTIADLFMFAAGVSAPEHYERFVRSGGQEISSEVKKFCKTGTLGKCRHPDCKKTVKAARFLKTGRYERLYYCSVTCFLDLWGDANIPDVVTAAARGSVPPKEALTDARPSRFKEEIQRAQW